MKAHIRSATAQELKTIKAIDETLFGDDTYPLFALRQLFDITNGLIMVAVLENRIVGYAIGHYEPESGNAWFLSLGVLPEQRGKGTGERLTKALIEAVEAKGARACRLTVHPGNTGGYRIYERLGFVAQETQEDYYGDGSPRIIMVRTSDEV